MAKAKIPESPLRSYTWWEADLRDAETRSKAIRIAKWMLQCEMSAEEAESTFQILDKKLTWPRSKPEKELLTKWAEKYKDLQQTS